MNQLKSKCATLCVRNQEFIWGSRTYVMGVVNVTPDSFSGDGILDPVAAANQANFMINNGATFIDVGGESTRPEYLPVNAQIELNRVLPAINAIRDCTNAVISIDSSKPIVVEAALSAGADIINPVFGLSQELKSIVLERELPVIIMHNQEKPYYNRNVVDEVLNYLDKQAAELIKYGLPSYKIILDPGIGFGKLPEHNLQLLHSLHRIVELGYPTLVGTSRKSFIGSITEKTTDKRVFGTAATIALAIASGIDIVRVHDVAEMIDVVKVSDAIVRGNKLNQ